MATKDYSDVYSVTVRNGGHISVFTIRARSQKRAREEALKKCGVSVTIRPLDRSRKGEK